MLYKITNKKEPDVADTKIVAIVLSGMLLWAVLLVASGTDTDAEVPPVKLTLKTAADNTAANQQAN